MNGQVIGYRVHFYIGKEEKITSRDSSTLREAIELRRHTAK